MQKRFYKLMQIWFDEDYKGKRNNKKNKRYYKRREKRRLNKLFNEKYK